VNLLRFIILLSSFKTCFTSSKILLRHICIIKDYTQSSCRINSMSLWIKKCIISGFLVSISEYPIDFKIFSRSLFRLLCNFWFRFWLFDCPKPWLNSCKFISFSWKYFMKDIWKYLIVFLTLFSWIIFILFIQFWKLFFTLISKFIVIFMISAFLIAILIL